MVNLGRALNAAAGLWAGSDIPDENEYLRGQVELLADMYGSPFPVEVDWDEVKDWYENQIRMLVEWDNNR